MILYLCFYFFMRMNGIGYDRGVIYLIDLFLLFYIVFSLGNGAHLW